MSGGRVDVRDRMLKSLVESHGALGENRMVLAMLLQNCRADEVSALAPRLPSFVRHLSISGRVPLSTARNTLLRQLTADGTLGPDALVAFPDDDCWYPPGFLSHVTALFERDDRLDFWFCRYASRPVQASPAGVPPARASMGQIVRNASSNTMFLRGRVVTAIGEFDEALGVGTPMGGVRISTMRCAHGALPARPSIATLSWSAIGTSHRECAPITTRAASSCSRVTRVTAP